MYRAVSAVFMAAGILFQGYCLQYFYGSFLKSRLGDKRRTGFCVALLYALFRAALVWGESSDPWDYGISVGKLALSLGFLFAVALGFYKGFCPVTLFLAGAFLAASDISRYTVAILFGELGEKLLGFWNFCAGKGILTSGQAFGIAVNIGIMAEWLFEYLLMALILYGFIKRIVGDFREKDYSMTRTELLFILIPAVVGLMVCVLLRIIIVTVRDDIPELLYKRYPILIFVLPAILLLSLLSILCGVKLFQDMIYLQREKSGRTILEKQVESLQEHMEEMERIYSGIRGMKHDMKNTFSIIQGLAGEGAEEKEELKAYLSGLNRSLSQLESRFQTGNTVVDILLNMKYYEAVRAVPDLNMDADNLLFIRELKIQSYDIGVILGNSLDNAIQACRKLKEKEPQADAFIRLCSMEKGNLLILKVENSFDGKLIRNYQEEFPLTDKEDKKTHGLGLFNIKSTAEKYQGTMDFKVEGKVFILSVMLKNGGGI
ncbi:ATP-binding protein [Lachnospiraceae bacterium 38-14]|mgnify:CR=1 FL=1|uniref:ATP-binding protein n=1 Tax=Roseburia sp. 1XD42-69 TaxID=2320088 RepID=UPI001FAA6D73|nr:ATP-binding protein [Roseburia sp. 1XD42-69]